MGLGFHLARLLHGSAPAPQPIDLHARIGTVLARDHGKVIARHYQLLTLIIILVSGIALANASQEQGECVSVLIRQGGGGGVKSKGSIGSIRHPLTIIKNYKNSPSSNARQA